MQGGIQGKKIFKITTSEELIYCFISGIGLMFLENFYCKEALYDIVTEKLLHNKLCVRWVLKMLNTQCL